MPSVAVSDIARMREKLFFEGDERATKLSAFWTLLLLAAAIASAGVVSDSTATVIGAMIVAPLMTPIMGVVLAVTIGDGRNLRHSLSPASRSRPGTETRPSARCSCSSRTSVRS